MLRANKPRMIEKPVIRGRLAREMKQVKVLFMVMGL
jgi:hypothetical protein